MIFKLGCKINRNPDRQGSNRYGIRERVGEVWPSDKVFDWCEPRHFIIHPSIHTSIHASIHPSMHPPIHPSIHPSNHASIHASIHPFIHPCIHVGARCNSVVRAFTHGAMGRRIDPSWAISRSSQCSTTGVTKVVVCIILCLMTHIKKKIAANRKG